MNMIDGVKTRKNRITIFIILSVFFTSYILFIGNKGNIILTVFACLICFLFLLKPIYALPAIYITTLVHEFFLAGETVGLSRLLCLIYFVISLFDMFVHDKKINLRKLIFLLILIIYNSISALFSVTGDIVPALSMAITILLYFFISHNQLKNVSEFIDSIAIASWLFTLFMTIIFYSGNMGSFDGRLTLPDINPNTVAIGMAQIASLSFVFIFLMRSKVKKIISFTCFTINIMFLFLLSSRSALFGTLASIIISIILYLIKKFKLSIKLILIVIFGCIVFIPVLYGILNTILPQSILHRFSIQYILETGGTGRTLIWVTFLKYVIPQNLLFGVGFGGMNTFTAITPYLIVPHGPHNFFISLLGEIGLIGTLMYLYVFIKSALNIIKYYFKSEIMLIPLAIVFTVLFHGIGEDVYTLRYLWIGMGISVLFINYIKDKKTEFLLKNILKTKNHDEINV